MSDACTDGGGYRGAVVLDALAEHVGADDEQALGAYKFWVS
jgi:hypothetical protein